MRKDERSVFFYDAKSSAWTRKLGDGLPGFPHYALAATLRALVNANQATITNAKGHAWNIQDIKLFANRCEMLINYVDPDAADPTLTDPVKKQRRQVLKNGDEGLEHSAHILWKFGDKSNNAPCTFLVEAAAGLGSTRVATILRTLLREASKDSKKFTIEDPEATRDAAGHFKRIPARPLIHLAGHPSKEFIQDLQKGELKEVELYSLQNKGAKWDSSGAATIDRSSVIIKANPQKATQKALNLLKTITSGHTSDYEFARIKFKSESDLDHTVNVHSSSFNLVNEDKYVRKERITGIGDNLPTAFSAINTVIMSKIRALS
ncbi:hypothetical protein [Luteibacter aegosomatissinici]|uniref:hypothetical protein n=1 Tax=Luteibacter aegosomatissinici TaxID=2911539 RepID=UPI001FF9E10A|nr:hypothetical protein [Luteibacter aegosomatissinici]UPG92668.1 hypothetical protein L2Y97_12405 [Luteibacter aegosomatissinici]